MRDVIYLLFHLLTTLAKLLQSGGSRTVIAENSILKQQLIIHSRSRQRAPNLSTKDRALLGFPLRYLFAAHPHAMGKVLRIIYRVISTHLLHKAGLQLNDGATGAVTLIQRFGTALNIHFHILFLDGVYIYRDNRPLRGPDRLSTKV